MGANESLLEEEEESQDEDDDDDHNEQSNITQLQPTDNNPLIKKLFQQSPEILPCHASASPLSPQISTPTSPVFAATANFSINDDRTPLEVYLISHGECELNSRPEFIAGRCDGVALTAIGKRQARALAVFFNSQGIRFSAVYCSPLDRARSMAVSVAKEMNFAEERIQSSEALMEMSMGHWEGCLQSQTYTPEILSLIDSCQPDFCAPSGESLRQVEFRMLQFLNTTLIRLPEKLRHQQNGSSQGFPLQSNRSLTNPPREGPTKKKSKKSRLQLVSIAGGGGGHDADDEMSPRVTSLPNDDPFGLNVQTTSLSSCIGVFTHSLPIKCLVTGLLGCSSAMSHKICIDDSSVTVLQHSWETGWHIKRLNDTAHLRLL